MEVKRLYGAVEVRYVRGLNVRCPRAWIVNIVTAKSFLAAATHQKHLHTEHLHVYINLLLPIRRQFLLSLALVLS
jgi:hypothetical protein